MENSVIYQTHIYANRGKVIDDAIKQFITALWTSGHKPYIQCDLEEILVLKGNVPSKPGQETIVFNLDSQAVQSVDFLDDEKGSLRAIMFTARFNQVATTVEVPLSAINVFYDNDDHEVSIQPRGTPCITFNTRAPLLDPSYASEVMMSVMARVGPYIAYIGIDVEAHRADKVPTPAVIVAEAYAAMAENGQLVAPMIGEAQPDAPGTVIPFSAPNHTGMPPVTNPTTTTSEAEDKPNFAEMREEARSEMGTVVDFSAARARRGK